MFGVAYAFAAHVMARQAREMIRAGLLGEIRQVHVEYFQEWAIDITDKDAAKPWRLDPEKVGRAFTVFDIGTHAKHLASFVTGLELNEVRAMFAVTGKPKALEDTAFMHLPVAGRGDPGHIRWSPRPPPERNAA